MHEINISPEYNRVQNVKGKQVKNPGRQVVVTNWGEKIFKPRILINVQKRVKKTLQKNEQEISYFLASFRMNEKWVLNFKSWLMKIKSDTTKGIHSVKWK
jgi:hypothetical protein